MFGISIHFAANNRSHSSSWANSTALCAHHILLVRTSADECGWLWWTVLPQTWARTGLWFANFIFSRHAEVPLPGLELSKHVPHCSVSDTSPAPPSPEAHRRPAPGLGEAPVLGLARHLSVPALLSFPDSVLAPALTLPKPWCSRTAL